MDLFNNKQKRVEMLKGITPTSKSSLKMQCLFACQGDIDEADKLYDYFAKDLQNLPDFDPVPPTWIDNTKQTFNGLVGWMKENQDTLVNAYSFFQQLIVNRGVLPTIVGETDESLPPIN